MRVSRRNARRYSAALTVAVFSVAASCVYAQQLQVHGAPTKVGALNGESLLPITSVSPAPNDGVLVIGGATRQQVFLVGTDGKARADVGNLSTVGARIASPVAAVFVSPNAVMVMDGQSAAWASIRLRGRRWFLDATGMMPLSRVSGVCRADQGPVYVMAKHDSGPGMIHRVEPPGRVRSSFGMRFAAVENPAVEYGHISCASNPTTISVASRLYPEVRTYSSAGTLLWTTRLRDFKPVGFETSGRLVRFVYPPDSTWDEIVSIFSPHPEVLAVQIARHRGRPGSSRALVLRTAFLSRARGSSLGSQTNVPMTYYATPTHLFARKQVDEGELQVYRYRYTP